MLTYKGYIGKVEYDDEAKVLFGRVINTKDVITFQASSAEEVEREFQMSVDDYLEFCASLGEEPEKPYSGKFVLRLPPEIHKRISIAANLANKSLNAWAVEHLADIATSELKSH